MPVIHKKKHSNIFFIKCLIKTGNEAIFSTFQISKPGELILDSFKMLREGVKLKPVTLFLLKRLSLVFSNLSGTESSQSQLLPPNDKFYELNEEELLKELRKLLNEESASQELKEVSSKNEREKEIVYIKTMSESELIKRNFNKTQDGRQSQCKWCGKTISSLRAKNHLYTCKKKK